MIQPHALCQTPHLTRREKRSLRGPLGQPSTLRALSPQTRPAQSAFATNPPRSERFGHKPSTLRALSRTNTPKSAPYGDPWDNPPRTERFRHKPSALRALWPQTLHAQSAFADKHPDKRSLRGPLGQPSPLRALWPQTLHAQSALATRASKMPPRWRSTSSSRPPRSPAAR